ncbi:MAG: transcription elongation factor GreA [Acidobacteria bacterium]|nr:MAG: transcription elongation factor GreA [Acidobacteriota bacterium]PIE89489.1 MAG: transcription elongation factor GreA [Acidobacteriota bacterium]
MKKLLDRLEQERYDLEYELKSVVPLEIRKAAAQGDLSENAEYEAALDKQRMLQLKVRTIQKRIGEVASLDMDRLPQDRIAYGTIVKLFDLDTDEEITYQLVLAEDADIKKKRISVSSPIGKALIGKEEGDEVTIKIPSGTKNFEVLGLTPYSQTEMDL